MDQVEQARKQLTRRLLMFTLGLVFVVSSIALATSFVTHNPLAVAGITFVFGCVAAVFATMLMAKLAIHPLAVVRQAILHIAPGDQHSVNAPDVEKLSYGKELAHDMITQVYHFASQQDGKELAEHRQTVIQATNIVSHLPLPLFVFNKEQQVVNASDAGLQYCHIDSAQLFGKPLYDSIHMEFSSEHTLEVWIQDCLANKATDTAYWQRVRVRLPDEKEMRQCDLAGYYNKDNPSGTEFIVTMFDRTEQYTKDDQDVGFVAMAVHELRTPLTMLRGYIEVFDEELDGKLNPELTSYMEKMKVSAVQLATFFNNILNVARMEQNQLVLKLTEGNWVDIIKHANVELQERAHSQGKVLELIYADNLPTVAVDQVSILEVINNLVENALKYSKENGRIIVNAHLSKEGWVETTIQDFGLGIPASVLPNLFEKFYRSHRSSSMVSGTGLGLYLSKAIIEAHGGEIWVTSKEGEGSTFGFKIQPYSELAEELKNNNNDGIERGAHGWIKNHSIYRG